MRKSVLNPGRSPARKSAARGKPKTPGSPRLRLEWIEAGSLTPNPRNWRRHPAEQMAALQTVLADPEIGWAGALLFNERTGRLVDGHARLKSVQANEVVPVLVGSWSEAAEKKILATLDPLAGMAVPDAAALAALVADIDLTEPALASLSSKLQTFIRAETKPESASEKTEGEAEPAEDSTQVSSQWGLMIECRDEQQQRELYDELVKRGLSCRVLSA